MDDHERLKHLVYTDMLKAANINPGAPIQNDLRSAFEIQTLALIRSSKRPRDPKKIKACVDSVLRRNADKERELCLPPIFAAAVPASSRPNNTTSGGNNNNNAAAMEETHFGRSALHHDRKQREARWAAQIKKEVDEYSKMEHEQRLQEEKEKHVRLEWLKHQVDEDHVKKAKEQQELREYMDQVETENRKVFEKQDAKLATQKAKRAIERQRNEEHLKQHRERKAHERQQQNEQERRLMEAISKEEKAAAEAEIKKKVERSMDLRHFLAQNRAQEDRHRDQMIHNRLDEIKLAPTQGILFDGATRREANVHERRRQQAAIYETFRKNEGADLHRAENQERLVRHMLELGDEERKKQEEKEQQEKELRMQKKEKLRVDLEEQMKLQMERARQERKRNLSLGLGAVLPGMSGSDAMDAAEKAAKQAKMREELKMQGISQRRARRADITQKI